MWHWLFCLPMYVAVDRSTSLIIDQLCLPRWPTAILAALVLKVGELCVKVFLSEVVGNIFAAQISCRKFLSQTVLTYLDWWFAHRVKHLNYVAEHFWPFKKHRRGNHWQKQYLYVRTYVKRPSQRKYRKPKQSRNNLLQIALVNGDAAHWVGWPNWTNFAVLAIVYFGIISLSCTRTSNFRATRFCRNSIV
jgi:hypothetical protein